MEKKVKVKEKVVKEIKEKKKWFNKDFLNRKTILIGSGVIAVIVIGLVLFITIYNNSTAVLTRYVKQVGTYYYEKDYYVKQGSDITAKTDFLKRFQKSGIKINLSNLEKSQIIVKDKAEIIKKLKKSKCDFDKTIVTYYPKDEFKAEDYDIKIKLSCDK